MWKIKCKGNFVLFFVLFLLTGCGKNVAEPDIPLQGETEIIENMETGQSAEEVSEEHSVENEPEDNTDYSVYLKKIWIADGWDFFGSPISLVFTEIEDDFIGGYFTFGGDLTLYLDRETPESNWPEFYGTVSHGEAICEYFYTDGEEGIFDLTFYDSNQITVMIERDEERSYCLRPFNISDVDFQDNAMLFETELDSWGAVTLFCANLENNKTYPWVLLVNEQGDILYEFYAPYHTASEVLDVIIEDMNGDGLKDVEVLTYFPPYSPDDDPPFEWYFYQNENGLFHLEQSNIQMPKYHGS